MAPKAGSNFHGYVADFVVYEMNFIEDSQNIRSDVFPEFKLNGLREHFKVHQNDSVSHLLSNDYVQQRYKNCGHRNGDTGKNTTITRERNNK
jgi:hypothetical protein